MELAIWIGIGFCVTQSAMFSGLNLAFFGVSRLQLEVEAQNGNRHAQKVLAMRKDGHLLLTTILWGNVGINVLLTLLSDSVLAGIGAFLFSTVVITLFGEIFPQAYFSRNALRMASVLSPVLRFYQFLLYPVAKPIAKLLDSWLGKEEMLMFRERDLRELIKQHVEHEEAEVDHLEGVGAMNFLELDDLTVAQEGEIIHPQSIVQLPTQLDLPVFPEFEHFKTDPFLQLIEASGKKWVILTDMDNTPQLILDADQFIREMFFKGEKINPYDYCHRPIVIASSKTTLDKVIGRLRVQPEHEGDDVIDKDIILVWSDEKRIITGADLLGRLLRGISKRDAKGNSAGSNVVGFNDKDSQPDNNGLKKAN